MVTLRKPKRSRAIIYLFECESKPYFLPPYVSVFAQVVKFSKKKKKNKTTTKNNRQTNKVNQRYTLLAFDLNKAHNQLSNKDNGL